MVRSAGVLRTGAPVPMAVMMLSSTTTYASLSSCRRASPVIRKAMSVISVLMRSLRWYSLIVPSLGPQSTRSPLAFIATPSCYNRDGSHCRDKDRGSHEANRRKTRKVYGMPFVSAHVLGSELQAQHTQVCSHRCRAPFSRGLF